MSQSSIETKSTALILLAHHHCSGNIASQRFAGLLKYLPRNKHTVFVISGPLNSTEHTNGNTEVLPISAPLLGNASKLARLEVFRHMALTRRKGGIRLNAHSWIAQAVNAARTQIQSEKMKGRQPVVMATYSPIDALIAARLVSIAEDVPLIQDFRDGLAFESLGRPGVIFKFLRKFLEAWAVRPASIVTTVSRPLVRHFQKTYADKDVTLLYNGFDVQEFSYQIASSETVSPCSSERSVTIGHFGRISASEAARLETLRLFISTLAARKFVGCLEFFGGLTDDEIEILDKSGLNCKLHGHVEREVALQRMKDMSALIILTGKNESVATGKIFEYLFSGRRILIATQVKNEATHILKEIGDDDMILDFSSPTNAQQETALLHELARPFTRSHEKIRKFDKSVQADELSELLQRIAGSNT